MHIQIDQVLRFSWDTPATGVVQLLRLTPRQSDRQQIVSWRVDVDADGSLTQYTDPFGNHCHIFYADKPLESLEIELTGVVQTVSSSGAITGIDDFLPPAIFRRSTALTAVTPAIAVFADGFRGDDHIATLHALMGGIHAQMQWVEGLGGVPANSALEGGKGHAEDFAHLFIAAARHLGYPARFISGHLVREGSSETIHAWAQAYIEGLGWTHFDPTQDLSISEAHVTVAVGLDSSDAVPVRSARRSGGEESLAVGMRGRESVLEQGQ